LHEKFRNYNTFYIEKFSGVLFMAREAKVGLLLGLVFIVAIAIVLRGVHETGPTLLEESLGISASNVKPLEMENLAVTVESLTTGKKVAVIQPPAPAGQPVLVANNTIPPQPVRYEQELPRRPYVNNSPQGKRTIVSPQEKLPDSVANALNKLNFKTVLQPVNVIAPQPKKRPMFGIYVVREGDDLSRIALKVYGRVEGKRWVNVEKIYKANRTILQSMDMVRQGQRLKIPTLENAMVLKSTPRPVVAKVVEKPRSVYVVKEGDSLWKIAEKKLGNGGRYEEIIELNKKNMPDENNLYVGMRLTLPVN